MNQIVAPQEIPSKLWGKPKPKETLYRLMRFHLRTACADGILLHNIVTGELVLLSESEQQLLERLPAPHEETMDDLIAAHFLVPVDFDETRSVEQLRRLMQTVDRKKEITGYTILPTSCCNARCFYCYEADYPHITMKEETADALIEFIAAHHGDKSVGLSWFGGEPTLGVKIIDKICTAMEEKGIKYSSSMISNGYLFSRELAEKAKNLWKLTNIQITLDGTEEVYNQVKSYIYKEGSPYRKVLENIGFLLEQEIRVSVRMNLDRHNAENLEQLIAELADRFAEKKYFSAYAWPLFDDCGFKPVAHEQADRLWLQEKAAELNRLIVEKKLGYSKGDGLPSIKVNYCMADNDGSVIVNPDGTFSKCEHYCCTENAGNLKDGFTDTALLAAWKKTKKLPDCETCVLVPACIWLERCFSNTQCFAVKRAQDIENYENSMRLAWKRRTENGDGKNECV